MADRTIAVREYTRPTIKIQITDFRNDSQRSEPIDISSYEFDLIVKRDATDPDAEAMIWIEGTFGTSSDWEDGVIWFELTHAETSLPPGRYTGEIRWWTDGGTEQQPHDSYSVEYTVEASHNIMPAGIS
jgi:hypothetical protein